MAGVPEAREASWAYGRRCWRVPPGRRIAGLCWPLIRVAAGPGDGSLGLALGFGGTDPDLCAAVPALVAGLAFGMGG